MNLCLPYWKCQRISCSLETGHPVTAKSQASHGIERTCIIGYCSAFWYQLVQIVLSVVLYCLQPGDFVSMTNVHALIHKPTDPLHASVPMVELCIHGGGAKYSRGLAITDDSLPAVQRLKLVLSECYGDRCSVSKVDLSTFNFCALCCILY